MIAIQKAIYIHVCNSVTLKISIHLNHPCHKLVHCLQKCPYDPAIPLLGIYPEETKIEKTHVPQCSLQHYLQQLGDGRNLDVN